MCFCCFGWWDPSYCGVRQAALRYYTKNKLLYLPTYHKGLKVIAFLSFALWLSPCRHIGSNVVVNRPSRDFRAGWWWDAFSTTYDNGRNKGFLIKENNCKIITDVAVASHFIEQLTKSLRAPSAYGGSHWWHHQHESSSENYQRNTKQWGIICICLSDFSSKTPISAKREQLTPEAPNSAMFCDWRFMSRNRRAVVDYIRGTSRHEGVASK